MRIRLDIGPAERLLLRVFVKCAFSVSLMSTPRFSISVRSRFTERSLTYKIQVITEMHGKSKHLKRRSTTKLVYLAACSSWYGWLPALLVDAGLLLHNNLFVAYLLGQALDLLHCFIQFNFRNNIHAQIFTHFFLFLQFCQFLKHNI